MTANSLDSAETAVADAGPLRGLERRFPGLRLTSGRELAVLALACLAAATGAVVLGPRYLAWLPALNAVLNATSTVLLVTGYALIKQGRQRAHTRAMLWAFAVSIAFLAFYLVYHQQLKLTTGQGGRPFTGQGIVRPLYYGLLISHVVLAATVPFLAGATIYLGLRDRRAVHRRVAVWTFPIWLYVSITGVLIYLMLYHVYPRVL